MTTMAKYLFILLLLPILAMANGDTGRYSKEKKISKSYTVSPTAALDVTNRYGTVYVTTWDQNQTVIDVVIKVSADKEDQLDKRLNSIDVAFAATTAKVTAETRIGNFSGRNVSMEINYTIKIPKKNSIDITNQYGATILGKIYGRAVLKEQYGSLTIDELNGSKNEISLQYSDGVKINYIGLSRISAQYSKLNITKADEELILNSEYTDTHIGWVNRLNVKGNYGDLRVDTASEVIADIDYLSARFGAITKLLNATVSYGDIKIDRITKEARDITIKSEYGYVGIKFDATHAFDFQAKATYGSVTGLQNITLTEKKDYSTGGGFYKGTYRNGGVAHITLENSYGDTNIAKL